MQLHPGGVDSAVLAACCLHNILCERSPAHCMAKAYVGDRVTHEVTPGAWHTEGQLVPMGRLQNPKAQVAPKNIRKYLMAYYNSSVGSVE